MTDKYKILIITALLAFMANCVLAQDVQLRIIDDVSLSPIEGVNIFCKDKFGKKQAVRSASNGVAVLSDLRFPMTISCSIIGYEKDTTVLTQNVVQWKNYGYYFTLPMRQKNTQLKTTIVTGQINPVLGNNSIYNVHTISEAEIAKRAAVNLTEVLQFEMNQFVSNDNILGASNNIGGIGAQNVKILLNGVPLNGSEAGFIDLNQINLNNVKRIETVQGPMSVMYGSNALGGVINIITKEATSKTEVGLRSYMDNLIRFNVAADVGFKAKKHNVKISAGRNMFQGWSPIDTLSRWLLWKPKMQYTADLNYSYKIKNGQLSLYSFYLNEVIENKGVPSISPFKAFAFDDYYITNRIRNTINYDKVLSDKEFFKSQNTLSIYNRKKNKYYKDLVSMESRPTSDIEDHDTSIFHQYHFRGAVNSSRVKSTDVILGYEANYETSKSTKVTDAVRNMFELGLFTSASYQIKNLSIMPSFRINMHSKFRQNMSYGLHFKYSPTNTLNYRLSFAQGYRTPTIKELYLEFIDNNHRILGNENLKQEEGIHAEISGDKKWNIGKKREVVLESNAMYNLLQNKISLKTINSATNELQYFNIADFANFVTFVKLKYSSKSLETSLGLSRTLIIQSTGLPANSFSEILTSASYNIPKVDVRFNAFYRYTANQPIYFVDGSFGMSKPLHVSNVSLSKSLLENNIRIQIGVKNLFNIQNNIIAEGTGSSSTGSAHGSESSTTLMLPRSVFFEVLYKI